VIAGVRPGGEPKDSRRALAFGRGCSPRGRNPQRLVEVVAVATADLTVIGLGRSDPSASRYIAAIQRRLAAQDRVRYVLHAMGTSLEGETADILALVGELHAVPFELGLPRVYTVLKLDERRDKAQTLEDKVASVRRALDADTP
jgi:uncharacterized protein (TIGR00106 family)